MRLRLRVGILTGLLTALFTLGMAGEAGAQQYPPSVQPPDIRVTTNVVKIKKVVKAQAGRAPQAQAGRAAGARKGGLAKTGSASVAPLAAAGAGLVVIGGFAVTAARRRRTAQALQP